MISKEFVHVRSLHNGQYTFRSNQVSAATVWRRPYEEMTDRWSITVYLRGERYLQFYATKDEALGLYEALGFDTNIFYEELEPEEEVVVEPKPWWQWWE